MLVECCKKSEILVAVLSSAIFRKLPVYVGQAVPFLIVRRILPIVRRLWCDFHGLSEVRSAAFMYLLLFL